MDASQYKDYVLTLLFMKYVSDKHASDPDALIEVPDGGSFDDMAKLKGDKEIGDRIYKIISRLAEANGLKGVIDQADFNDESKLGTGKEMQDRLSKLVAIFEGLDFRANRGGGDDLLGDAYEYLMRHFATESGKSKGQFYTPAEVSRILAKVVGIGPDTRQHQTIYDPTCGSGSLLLKAADEAPRGITVYGQEMDNATWSLARMNLILHGRETAEIWRGNTLAAPYFKNPGGSLKTFDFAVANPPFSAKAWSNGLDPEHDVYGRFAYGVPPTRNGDYGFLLHLVTSLKSRGKGAIILPHGVLFRGNREALQCYVALVQAESKASRAVKKAQSDLDGEVLARYAALSEREIKNLVVEDKWLASIRAAVEAEVQHLTQRLPARIVKIEDRYARPLPELERDVEAFSAKVGQHHARMGIAQ